MFSTQAPLIYPGYGFPMSNQGEADRYLRGERGCNLPWSSPRADVMMNYTNTIVLMNGAGGVDDQAVLKQPPWTLNRTLPRQRCLSNPVETTAAYMPTDYTPTMNLPRQRGHSNPVETTADYVPTTNGWEGRAAGRRASMSSIHGGSNANYPVTTVTGAGGCGNIQELLLDSCSTTPHNFPMARQRGASSSGSSTASSLFDDSSSASPTSVDVPPMTRPPSNTPKTLTAAKDKLELLRCPSPGCNYTTRQNVTLRTHLARKHRVNNLISCPHKGCSYQVNRQDNLKRHLALVHFEGVKWHSCAFPNCKYRSKQKAGVKRHVTNVHGNETTPLAKDAVGIETNGMVVEIRPADTINSEA